jgi:hypothetical protein
MMTRIIARLFAGVATLFALVVLSIPALAMPNSEGDATPPGVAPPATGEPSSANSSPASTVPILPPLPSSTPLPPEDEPTAAPGTSASPAPSGSPPTSPPGETPAVPSAGTDTPDASPTPAATSTPSPAPQHEPTPTPLPATEGATQTGTAQPQPTGSAPPSDEGSPTATSTDEATAAPTSTATLLAPTVTDASPSTTSTTPSATSTPSETPSAFPLSRMASVASFAAGSVLINEVAWSGTGASANDEWIELWNPGADPIELDGWSLSDGGDIDVALQGSIAPFGFYLLERTDDSTVSDVAADQLYTGSLSNSGERLVLRDPSAKAIDTANDPGDAWPAGSTSPRASMERHGRIDLPSSWRTFPGVGGNGLDADGGSIWGTPRQPNAPSPPTPTPTGSPTSTPTETDRGYRYPEGAILINEVAWAGTRASASDEWIELYNPGADPIDLEGWRLTDDGDIDVPLRGTLLPGSYFLLERTDDDTVSDIPADGIYAGSLSNGGERLRLRDPSGGSIDVVNPDAGAWRAGDATTRSSMERGAGRWRTFTGYFGRGLDAAGHAIRGTPGGPNSLLFPTPTPTWIPGRVVINEVLIRPRHDWEGTGGVTTDDEFIELFNRGPLPVNLGGWTLDDIAGAGSSPFTLPPVVIQPGEFRVFFRSRSGIALNDGGDDVRLSAPDGHPVDTLRYLRVRAANLSYGRLPDGDDGLAYGLWPTPGKENHVYRPPGPFPAGAVLIEEVAWAGTRASATHEWIELFNPGADPINLYGWTLTDGGDITAHLIGEIQPQGVYVLERTSDDTLPTVPADRIYSGTLSDRGEPLRLLDPTGTEIDVVNPDGAAWPAGDRTSHAAMERIDGWRTVTQGASSALDALGNPILGTPGEPPPPAISVRSLESPGCRSGPCP